MTVKNYPENKGLSWFIHQDSALQRQVYEVNGPLGKGLEVQPTGTYVAYAAGTGILVFIDLIGHLILSIADKFEGTNYLGEATNKVDLNNFRLVLFSSFADEKEAVCLQLI